MQFYITCFSKEKIVRNKSCLAVVVGLGCDEACQDCQDNVTVVKINGKKIVG